MKATRWFARCLQSYRKDSVSSCSDASLEAFKYSVLTGGGGRADGSRRGSSGKYWMREGSRNPDSSEEGSTGNLSMPCQLRLPFVRSFHWKGRHSAGRAKSRNICWKTSCNIALGAKGSLACSIDNENNAVLFVYSTLRNHHVRDMISLKWLFLEVQSMAIVYKCTSSSCTEKSSSATLPFRDQPCTKCNFHDTQMWRQCLHYREGLIWSYIGKG